VHSPLRQAIALAVRLGCMLLQIICILADDMLHGKWMHGGLPNSCHVRGSHLYTLSKARYIWLGHTVNACLSYRVSGGYKVHNCFFQSSHTSSGPCKPAGHLPASPVTGKSVSVAEVWRDV
jgi:hypothetical protein